MRITGGSRRRTIKSPPRPRPTPKKPPEKVEGKNILQTLIDRKKAVEEAIAAFRRRR